VDFTISEEQRRLQERAYNFAVNEFKSVAKDCDREEKYPERLMKKASEAGLVGCFIPKEYGGAGLGHLDLALTIEQLSRVDMGLSIAATGTTFGSENILFFGTDEQKKKYLPKLVNGELISAGAFTEPDAGTDVASGRTTAIRKGDEYIINGSKVFITNGTICDYMVTFCVTDPNEEKKYRRHSLILIESNRKGVTRQKITGKMGIRSTDTAEIAFADVCVPCENLIGEEGKGFYQLMHFFDVTRTMVAGQGVGIAQGALDQTITYLKGRKTSGKPLISSQWVQFQLAEMATKIELARNITYKAAWKVDQDQIDSALNAMAKYYSGEMAVWVCDRAVQLHGRHGLMDDYDIQRFYRDAKLLEIFEGTKEAEKMMIGRRLSR